MARETVAIDVDDVIAAHAEAFVNFSNEQYGTNLGIDDYSEHWHDLWQADNEEVERRALLFHTPERTQKYERIKDSARVLGRLSVKRNLVVVTARPEGLLETTHKWLDEYFPNLFTETHFVPIWVPGNTVTKAEICRQIGADYLIDDLAKHCNIAAEVGIKALLFGDYSWNRCETTHPRVVRVRDWQAVQEYFDEQG